MFKLEISDMCAIKKSIKNAKLRKRKTGNSERMNSNFKMKMQTMILFENYKKTAFANDSTILYFYIFINVKFTVLL